MGGDIATDWKRFRSQWENYEIAADLADQPTKKRTAIFLACIGSEAYQLFQTLQFTEETDRQDIEKVIDAFQRHCIREVNVTYERYVFNRRVQDTGETFDAFLADLRRLARTCDFGTLEESIIRDRIVIGIREDSTRRKLLQTRKLDLQAAIDACKANEIATRQLRAISTPEEVDALAHPGTRASTSRTPVHQQQRHRGERQHTGESSSSRRCHYCDRQHAATKENCPAYGHTCRRCSKKHHFEAVCMSGGRLTSNPKKNKQQVCNLDFDDSEDELLSLASGDRRRLFSRLIVDGRTVRFLLDCGSTVNLLPASFVDGLAVQLRPATTPLRMFDDTALKTAGVITAMVQHPRTKRQSKLDFHVAAKHQQAILGLEACLEFDLLEVREENICTVSAPPSLLSESKPLTRAEVLAAYGDLFEGLGTLAGNIHLDVDPAVTPVQMPLRRLPIPIKESVQRELQQMCKIGIIEPVTEPSAWISAMLVVAKTDGRVRICIDPKPLNKALRRCHYPMQTIDDILPQLAKARVFSTVDAKNGFWHLKLDKESSKLTTFESPFGRFRWLRLPLGVSPAPELFQARIHEALRGLQGIACIADDILIFGSGNNMNEARLDHDKNLLNLLERCRTTGLRLNKDKFQLNRETTTYMGYQLTANGLQPDPKKVEAIRQMPPPTDRKGVMRLLGMATFLAKFCPNFSEVTAKLRELLSKTVEYRWDETTHGVAFQKLKDLLSSAPVLRYYDVTLPVVIQCDASQSGLGAAILQDGRVVEYASRALSLTEKNSYAQIERELLSIVFSMNRFHSYVYGRKVVVETDHKPLISITKKSLTTAP